jgi:hypothetical protein
MEVGLKLASIHDPSELIWLSLESKLAKSVLQTNWAIIRVVSLKWHEKCFELVDHIDHGVSDLEKVILSAAGLSIVLGQRTEIGVTHAFFSWVCFVGSD